MHDKLVPQLLDIQERHDWLPPEELEFLALRAGVPLYRIQAVTTFFPHFRREKPPPGLITVHVCKSMSCYLRGSSALLQAAREAEQKSGGRLQVHAVPCLGRCDRAPVAFVSKLNAPDGFHDRLRV